MKKLLIILCVLLALIGGGWFVLTSVVIDADEIGSELKAALEQTTGRDVQLSQTTSVQLFPVPEVSFAGLRMSNAQGASSPDFLSSSRMTLKLDFAGLLAGDARPAEVVLEEVRLNAEVLPGGQQNWRFAGSGSGFGSYLQSTPVRIDGGMLTYANAATGARTEQDGIAGVFRFEDSGAVVSFNGEMASHTGTTQLMLRMNSFDPSATTAVEVPFQLVAKRDATTYSLQGKLAASSKDPEFIGQLKIETPNLWSIVSQWNGKPLQAAGDEAQAALTVEGDMRLNPARAQLSETHVFAKGSGTFPAVNGKLDVEYQFGSKPSLRMTASAETVDMDYLRESYGRMFYAGATAAGSSSVPAGVSEQDAEDVDVKSLVANMQGALDIRIDSLLYNGRSLNDIVLKAALGNGRMQVNDGRATLPGNTRMVYSGLLLDDDEGLRYDGKFEMQGQEMEQFLSLFTPLGVDMPPMELGRFGVRTNVSFSPTQYRFSEFQAIVSKTRMAGSLIFHLGDRPKLVSYLRVADIDLDTVSQAVGYLLPESAGVKKATAGAEELFDDQYVNTRYDWLSSVGLDVDADFFLQNFVLLSRKGDEAKFQFNLRLGEAQLRGLKARYNGADIAGDYALRTKPGTNPQIVASGSISEINMVDFFPELSQVRNDREWQEYLDKQLQMPLLQTYRVNAKLRLGQFNLRNYHFSNMDTEWLLEDSKLSVDRFNGTLWDGAVKARFAVQAGAVPSFSLAFALQNASLIRLSEATPLLKHAAGTTALTGTLNTSGLTLRSWFKSMQGEVRAQASDISVQGFGITNLARAVSVARTVSDVQKAATMATNGGVTRLRSVSGSINVVDGKASTPRMTFTSSEAKGELEGSVDLINETLDLGMRFYLLNTAEQGANPPMIKLTMQGDIDNVQKQLETRELENYVSQKAAKRALGQSQ